MPLADDAGAVPTRLQQLGDRDLIRRETLRRVVAKYFRCGAARLAVHPAPDREAAGEQRRSTRRADWLNVEVGPLLALGGHRVETRRPDVRTAERSEVAVAEIVGEDDDDVRRWRCGRLRMRRERD